MITVIIPVFNEEESVAGTIAEVKAALAGMALDQPEILIVDDGSTDRTGEILDRIEGITVRHHPHNIGYGRALKTGIAAARHETVVITDADLTYPIGDLGRLLEVYRRGFDMVVGARTGAHYRESATKAPLRAVLKWLVEFTTGREIPDINSGFRIFSKSAALGYAPHLCDTFSFTTSITLSYMMTGRFVTYVPIDYRQRSGTTKVRLFRDTLRTLQYIVQATVYYNPLKIFLLVSLLLVACSVGAFLVSALTAINLGYILGVAGLVLAVVMFGIGLLAVLLKQIMDK